MKFKNKTILVTGAGGFIGSHSTEALVKEGAQAGKIKI
jgi:nucleoside-diphosphate-sugar epimerase